MVIFKSVHQLLLATPVGHKSYIKSACLRVGVGVGVYLVCNKSEASSYSCMGVWMYLRNC